MRRVFESPGWPILGLMFVGMLVGVVVSPGPYLAIGLIVGGVVGIVLGGAYCFIHLEALHRQYIEWINNYRDYRCWLIFNDRARYREVRDHSTFDDFEYDDFGRWWVWNIKHLLKDRRMWDEVQDWKLRAEK